MLCDFFLNYLVDIDSYNSFCTQLIMKDEILQRANKPYFSSSVIMLNNTSEYCNIF